MRLDGKNGILFTKITSELSTILFLVFKALAQNPRNVSMRLVAIATT